MQYCKKCNIKINGNKYCCPLCQGLLNQIDAVEDDSFPVVPKKKYTRNIIIRIISFICIAISVISVTIDILSTPGYYWSLIVCGSALCLWISLILGINQRRNLFRNTLMQLLLINTMCFFWDCFTGMNLWSLEFVLPITTVVILGVMVVLLCILHTQIERLSFYVLFVSVYGLIPVIFIITKYIHILIPSAICVCCSIVSLTAVLLFQTRNLIQNISKKFHI